MATPGDSEFVTRHTPETGTQSLARGSVFPTTTNTYRALTGKRILVVEDDPLSLELMRIVLTKNGFNVALASGGRDAVSACQGEDFDLVFMDLQMPEMDGFLTATRIRAVERNGRRVPIVALTASNISAPAYARFKTEFAQILTKPFEISILLRAIEECTQDTSQPMMDIPSGLRHFGLDREQFREIFAEFRESLPGRLEEMEASLRENNLEDLSRRAHNLKGLAANVGAVQLSHASARLDNAAEEGELQDVEQALEEVRSALHLLQESAQSAIENFFSATTHAMRDT